MEVRGGRESRKEKRQVNRQGDVLREEKEGVAFHLMTATSQRERGGTAKLRKRES